jgi:hypothetical protein
LRFVPKAQSFSELPIGLLVVSPLLYPPREGSGPWFEGTGGWASLLFEVALGGPLFGASLPPLSLVSSVFCVSFLGGLSAGDSSPPYLPQGAITFVNFEWSFCFAFLLYKG